MLPALQTYDVPFTDTYAIYQTEMWDPVTQLFTVMAGASEPRTYHSIALLLPDARIFNGGGGLCGTGCACVHCLVRSPADPPGGAIHISDYWVHPLTALVLRTFCALSLNLPCRCTLKECLRIYCDSAFQLRLRTHPIRQHLKCMIRRAFGSMGTMLGGNALRHYHLSRCHPRRQNHPDGRIYTPPYLLNGDGTPAARPGITTAPATALPGDNIAVTTNTTCTAFSMIRVRPHTP